MILFGGRDKGQGYGLILDLSNKMNDKNFNRKMTITCFSSTCRQMNNNWVNFWSKTGLFMRSLSGTRNHRQDIQSLQFIRVPWLAAVLFRIRTDCAVNCVKYKYLFKLHSLHLWIIKPGHFQLTLQPLGSFCK